MEMYDDDDGFYVTMNHTGFVFKQKHQPSQVWRT